MFIPPMLLEKREDPFNDERYLFEPKIDGHRNLLSVEAGQVRLFTRNNNDVTARYPELHDVLIADHSDVVLDGEVACQDPETGAIDFELIQSRFSKRKPLEIQQAMISNPVHYYIFDILHYRGRDLRALPLTERKMILSEVVRPSPYCSVVMSVPSTGNALFDVIKQRGMEGIVAKKMASKYVGQRSADWLKIINYTYATIQISGYRKNQFGWIAQHNGRPVGVIELAVPNEHKRAFYGLADRLKTGEDRNYVYLEPSINARVRFRNWTRKGMLRSPEFVI
ncbi:RNA ligase family protein [Cohnella phaseoli]|uniref:DNA ligase-1 n=1 Tax=Cohnella phaseoli TaxID=456490 RepID=A0A3D9KKD2_9BACL|nr:RNA ligase family protein [Cohnella phaseoli]RED86336.1 DNA ligase-1 [Cohnella phaseoli]